MLTEQQITKFQSIYRDRFGRDISREEALREGVKLVCFLELIFKPCNDSDYQRIEELSNREERGIIDKT